MAITFMGVECVGQATYHKRGLVGRGEGGNRKELIVSWSLLRAAFLKLPR